jgi:hypothetical protein
LTRIKDQKSCGNCYNSGGVGLVEAMLRIEHGYWSLRSEGDVGDSISFLFGAHSKCQGGSPLAVLDWITTNGVADPGCWPSLDTTQVAQQTPDRLGRVGQIDAGAIVHVTTSGSMSHRDTMRTWIDLNGPLVVCFTCHGGLDNSCKNNSVYKVPSNPGPGDGHCVLIVGYDDAKKAWLIRNSWGEGWGTGGYGWFGYGQGANGLEQFSCSGVLGAATSPDAWTRRRSHNGIALESSHGVGHRDLEVWSPGPGGTIHHYRRDGQTHLWSLFETLATPGNSPSAFQCDGVPSVIDSTYFGNFEVVYRAKNKNLWHGIYDQAGQRWTQHENVVPVPVDGTFGLVQVNNGAPGNFECVVLTNGQLENFWRDNSSNAGGPWVRSHTLGSNVAHLGASLVERWIRNDERSTPPTVSGTLFRDYWKQPAGLDLVCVLKSKKMQRWWRDDPNTDSWMECESFGTNVASAPVMIRSQSGTADETVPGNYELCVVVGGYIKHWWTPGFPQPADHAHWTRSAKFKTNVSGQKVKRVLGLVQSSFGFHLEVVAELTNGALQHFWRDGSGWHHGHVFGTVA